MYLVLHARNPLPATDPYHFTLTRGAFTSGIEYYLGYLLYFPYLGGLRPVVYLILLLVSIALRWLTEWWRGS